MRDSRDAQNAFSALEAIARRWGFRTSYSQTADSPPVTRAAREAPAGQGGSDRDARHASRPSQDPRMPLSGLRTMILIGDFPRAWVAWGIPPPDHSPSDGQVYLTGFQTTAPVTRVSRVSRVTRPMGGRANGRRREYIHYPPRTCVRVCARARLYEKENYFKITCCSLR